MQKPRRSLRRSTSTSKRQTANKANERKEAPTMKRTEIYINGKRATKYDIAVLFEHLDEITDMHRTPNGNLYIKTV